MATNTTNYSLIKPAVNDPTDQDLWGGYLNTNFDTIDSTLKTASDSVTTTKTTTYTVTTSDRNKTILADASGGAFTITLPAAATAADGFRVTIKKTDSSANAVTIDGDGSETIDGSTTLALSTQYESVTLVTNGSNWFKQTGTASVDDASTTIKGIIEIATDAEMLTGTATDKALVPSNFLQNSLGSNGYYKFPNGLMIQWGTAGASSTSISFPTAFSTAVYAVLGYPKNATIATIVSGFSNVTTSGFTKTSDTTDSYYFAVGK